jgi:hypothetical protein
VQITKKKIDVRYTPSGILFKQWRETTLINPVAGYYDHLDIVFVAVIYFITILDTVVPLSIGRSFFFFFFFFFFKNNGWTLEISSSKKGNSIAHFFE